jgi:PiT family inorganic phosphate transporter
VVDHYLIFGALLGAIAWNVVTWYYGIPSSSSHALIGGIVGAAIAKAGTDPLIGAGIMKTVAFIVISPLFGYVLGSLILVAVAWICRNKTQRRVDKWFRRLQLVSAASTAWGTAAMTRKRPSASSGCC